MRFYARHPDKSSFTSKADKEDWFACQRAMKFYTPEKQEMLLQVYARRDTLEDNVYEVAKEHRVDQNVIWSLLGDLDRTVAKERGLL
jgi:hypothetical protein